MPGSPSSTSPNLSKIGFGAQGNVDVRHDASQHTIHNSGLSPVALFAVICVIMGGFVLVVLALRPAAQPLGTTPVSVPKAWEPSPLPPVDTPPVIKPIRPPSRLGAEDEIPPSPHAELLVVLDRPDRIYYAKDRQMIRITVPRRGHLYAASVWADGQMRILCHPELLVPVPGPVDAGQTVEVPAINMSFTPPDISAATTEEEVRVVLTDNPLPGITADRRTDIRAAWEAALGTVVGSPHQRMRVRGGELAPPEPLTQPTTTGILQHTVPYRMIRGQRPVSDSLKPSSSQ